jgi:hypothetical protein
MECVAPGGVCWSEVSGDAGCSEPDPHSPRTCGPSTPTCETDEDCPREFECTAGQEVCPAIACAEDAPDCTVECTPAEPTCAPKQIVCTATSDCPADWVCPEAYDGCASDLQGAAGESGEAPTCEEQASPRFCYPEAWESIMWASGGMVEDGGLASDGSARDDDSSAADAADDDAADDSAGGCSTSGGGTGGLAGWLVALAAVLPFAARRRAAAVARR